jgi:phospholipase C
MKRLFCAQFGALLVATHIFAASASAAGVQPNSVSPQAGAPAVPVILTPSSLTFDPQLITTTSPAQKITLKNNQSVTLTISSIATSSGFAQTSTCPISPATLAAGATCTISVTFTPASLGTINGTLSVSDNAAGSPQTASLTGTGTLDGVAYIGITPAVPSAPSGTQLQLSATGQNATGQLADITQYAAWSSSDQSIAKVSSTGLIQALSQGTATITASLDSINQTAKFTVTAPSLSSITVSPSNPSIPFGANQQFTAAMKFSDGSTKDATSVVTWSSSNTSAATISSSGLATIVAPGKTTTISASLQSVSGNTLLTTTKPACAAPPAGLIGWWSGDGNTVDLAGTNSGAIQNGVTYSRGEVGSGFTFSQSGASVLVNAPEYSPTAGTLMFWFLSTSGGAMTGSLLPNGNHGPGVAIDPNGNLLWELGNLTAQSLGQVSSNTWHHFALTYFTSGTAVDVILYLDGTQVTTAATIPNTAWSPQVLFGGYLGAVEPSFAGSMDEIEIFNKSLTPQQVQQAYHAFGTGMCKPTLQSIAVTPGNPSVAPGTTQQMTATGTYNDSSTHDLTSSAAWSSSSGAATVTATGLVIGAAPGTSAIKAFLNGQQGTVNVTVGPALTAIQVSPPTAKIAVGTSKAFTATGTYSDSSQRNVTAGVTWSSSSGAATVGSNGVALGVSPGQTSITAALGAINDSANLTVTSATLKSITVTPTNPAIAPLTTDQFTATGSFSDNSTQDLTTQAVWSSSNPAVASISTTGLATAGAALGSSTISASLGSVNGQTLLTVNKVNGTLQSIVVSPGSSSLSAGFTEQLTAQGRLSDGTVLDVTSAVQWSSSATSVVTVSNINGTNGLASAKKAGGANITATLGTVNGGATVTVSKASLASMQITPAGSTIPPGGSTQFTATGTLTDGTTSNITSIVTWASSALTVAAISNTDGSKGLATSVGSGTTTVSAKIGPLVGATSLGVQDQLVSISVSPVNATISPSTTKQFTATGLFLSGLTADLTKNVLWTSSDLSAATINANGLATGMPRPKGSGLAGQTVLTASLGTVNSTAMLAVTPIQHIIIMVQENRSTDNLFQDPVLISRGADIAQNGLDSKGNVHQLQQIPLNTGWGGAHEFFTFNQSYDKGKMDGFDLVSIGCNPAKCNTIPPNPMYSYVNPADIGPYFQMAEQYVFADRMFQTNEGPSWPAHMFVFNGTSAPDATSNMFVAENPYPMVVPMGCGGAPTSFVKLVNPQGVEDSTTFPCFDPPALVDWMDLYGISWKYYTSTANYLFTAPNGIAHLYYGSDWVNNVIQPSSAILTDIAAGDLAAVSWVTPTGAQSDHANWSNGTGPSWIASVVNAIGNSPYWNSTAIMVTWDDWGGWYDHVPPPKVIRDGTSWGSGYLYGFRVPLLLVSPYAKPAHISHTVYDFGSPLRLIEESFNLPSMGFADAHTNDLSDSFDYSQNPIQFKNITAPFGADYFLNDKTEATDPDDY